MKTGLPQAAIVYEPGSTVRSPTGSWRTMTPVVDTGACTGCMKCADLCPDAAIAMVGKKAVIDLLYCKGCGICAVECPHGAIAMEHRRGGAKC